MKKSILVIVVVVVAAVGLYFVPRSSAPTSAEPIKIGAILPLTGELASLGENAKNGAMLAYNELSAETKNKLQIIFEDDQWQPKNTISAFNKLVDVDRVAIILCLTSGPCSAIAPLADQRQVPLIAVASAQVQKERSFVVRLEIATSEEAKQLLAFVEEKGYKKIASAIVIHDGIQSAYQAMRADAGFSSKEIISETTQPTEKDFRTVIAKLIAKQPDVILVGLLPGAAGEFGKQARTLGYKGDFIGFNFIEGKETLVAAKGALDGIVYTQAAESAGSFVERYEAAYQKTIGPGSAHFYDAINLIAMATTQGRSSSAELNKFLNSIQDFDGALGFYGSTQTHEFTLPVSLKTIRNNKFTKYEP